MVTPSASQSIAQPIGTQFSVNNQSGARYVTASDNWSINPTGSLSAGTQATVTLAPCPVGVDTTGFSMYYVYLSVQGTPEPAMVGHVRRGDIFLVSRPSVETPLGEASPPDVAAMWSLVDQLHAGGVVHRAIAPERLGRTSSGALGFTDISRGVLATDERSSRSCAQPSPDFRRSGTPSPLPAIRQRTRTGVTHDT